MLANLFFEWKGGGYTSSSWKYFDTILFKMKRERLEEIRFPNDLIIWIMTVRVNKHCFLSNTAFQKQSTAFAIESIVFEIAFKLDLMRLSYVQHRTELQFSFCFCIHVWLSYLTGALLKCWCNSGRHSALLSFFKNYTFDILTNVEMSGCDRKVYGPWQIFVRFVKLLRLHVVVNTLIV
jgi:hypothetical protein